LTAILSVSTLTQNNIISELFLLVYGWITTRKHETFERRQPCRSSNITRNMEHISRQRQKTSRFFIFLCCSRNNNHGKSQVHRQVKSRTGDLRVNVRNPLVGFSSSTWAFVWNVKALVPYEMLFLRCIDKNREWKPRFCCAQKLNNNNNTRRGN